MSEPDDPTGITAIAVRRDDVVTALEANERGSGRRNVLRITGPYSGRMRARLHREGGEDYDPGIEAIHVPPSAIVDEFPAFPAPDDTEDELRSDPDRTYTKERHREYHDHRVQEWRETITDRIVDSVELDTAAGPHEVRVVVIGDP